MTRRLQRMIALLLAVLGPAGSVARACPESVPDGLAAVPVADDAAVNGMPLSMLQVHGKAAALTVLDAVQRQWTSQGFAVQRSSAAGWDIVSALSERCLTTLQLVDRGGAFGYLAVNRLRQSRSQGLAGVPLPRGAVVGSTVVSTDDGRRGSTTTASAAGSIVEAQQFFQRQLRADGWGAVRTAQRMDRSGQVAGVLLTAQRNAEQIDVTLRHGQGTQIVVNVAELP